jgi:two-component system phosphate regulon response regulator PhoB
VHLGPTEFRLLRHLLEHQGRVFNREQLLDAVWGHDVCRAAHGGCAYRRLRKALNNGGGGDAIASLGRLRALRE